MNQILLTCYFFTAILLYYPMAIQSSPVDVSASLIFTLPVSILLYLWYTTIRRKEFQWKIQKKNPNDSCFWRFYPDFTHRGIPHGVFIRQYPVLVVFIDGIPGLSHYRQSPIEDAA